jgi:predicted nucleic acid-binding protein
MSYWDTSALGKLYLPEPDSADFLRKAANEPLIVTAKLTLIEMRRVAFRKESEGFIQAGAAEAVLNQMNQDIAAGEIRIVEMDASAELDLNTIMVICYRRTPPLPLRTLDAIHLTAARVAGETEMVATDRRLREAAKLLGFSLFPA